MIFFVFIFKLLKSEREAQWCARVKGAVASPVQLYLGAHSLAAQILIHRSMFVEQTNDSCIEYPLVAWHLEISAPL